MNILILGSGMMGQAIAFDLDKYSNFDTITVADKDNNKIKSAKHFLRENILLNPRAH